LAVKLSEQKLKLLIYQKRNRQETPYWPQSKGEPDDTKNKELVKQGNIYMLNAIEITIYDIVGSYKQKEMIPKTVANGNTVMLVISHFFNPHFSSNLRTLQAKILV
jgi:hypothetical protein